MEWRMPNGTTFHTREIRRLDREGAMKFQYTSVTAIIDGVPFAGRLDSENKNLEPADLLSAIAKVPVSAIYPRCPQVLTTIPANQSGNKLFYFKSPSFELEDIQLDQHFVADRVLSEATLYELLARHPHPNIARYHGCVVDAGRIQKICLSRYESNLYDTLWEKNPWPRKADIEKWLKQIYSAATHLHKLGYCHNDINEHNICLDKDRNAVLIDFDAAELIGKPPKKGQLVLQGRRGRVRRPCEERWDLRAIKELKFYIDLVYL